MYHYRRRFRSRSEKVLWRVKTGCVKTFHHVPPSIHGWRLQPLNPEHPLNSPFDPSVDWLWLDCATTKYTYWRSGKHRHGSAYTHCRIVIPFFLAVSTSDVHHPSSTFMLLLLALQVDSVGLDLLPFLFFLVWFCCSHFVNTRDSVNAWDTHHGNWRWVGLWKGLILLCWCLRCCWSCCSCGTDSAFRKATYDYGWWMVQGDEMDCVFSIVGTQADSG